MLYWNPILVNKIYYLWQFDTDIDIESVIGGASDWLQEWGPERPRAVYTIIVIKNGMKCYNSIKMNIPFVHFNRKIMHSREYFATIVIRRSVVVHFK